MECENYKKLGGWDVKLLLELTKQFNSYNNGDLSAVWSQFSKNGWNSKGTLDKSIKQLEKYGLIQRTRQGGRHKCNLYALTWREINDCKGKLDVAATNKPSNLWKLPVED